MTFFASLMLVLNSFSHSTNIPLDVTSAPINDSTQLDVVFSNPILFEDSILSLYNIIGLNEYNLSYTAFRYGMIGYFSLEQDGKLGSKKLITIIDFTKPSSEKRFYTIDLEKLDVKYYTYVSHGKNTGWNTAESFSNIVHSNASSLGFYITAETYVGSKGYSLKLDGQDKGYNDNIRTRAVVMHEADYVSEAWIKKYGRLGRSQGCPALPKELSKKIIDSIKHHTLIFAYSENETFLNTSSHLKLDNIIHSGNSESVTNLQ
jgi:hypothetical protein